MPFNVNSVNHVKQTTVALGAVQHGFRDRPGSEFKALLDLLTYNASLNKPTTRFTLEKVLFLSQQLLHGAIHDLAYTFKLRIKGL